MGEIQISPGETELLVKNPDSDYVAEASVSGGTVWFSHSPRPNYNNSRIVENDDRVRLRRFRGKSVYAHNPGTETVTVGFHEAGFFLDFLTRALNNVRTRKEDASKERKVFQEEALWSVTTGNLNDGNIYTNNSGETVFLEQVTFNIDSAAGYTDNLDMLIRVDDSSGNPTVSSYANSMHFPMDYSPAIPVEDGGAVDWELNNQSGSDKSGEFGILLRRD